MKSIKRLLGLTLPILTGPFLTVPGIALGQGRGAVTTLQLIESVVDTRSDSGIKVTNGSVSITTPSSFLQVQWSPPGNMDASGVLINFATQAQSNVGAGVSVSGGVGGDFSFEYAGGEPGKPGGDGVALTRTAAYARNSGAAQVRVRPDLRYVKDGQVLELRVGMAFTAGVTYRYRATASAGGGVPPEPGRRLTARLECPADQIVISALPSLNCHVLISGWRRNTADPVEVSFPSEVDTFGNHGNGIQLNGRGSQSVNNWTEPQYSWGIFVFACPSQSHTGANCYNSVTTGPTASVPILVRQKDQTVQLTLSLRTIARGVPGGGNRGRPPVTGSLGCFKDTPTFDLSGYLTRSQANTVEGCVATCQQRGFAYAGVQYGQSCLCGNSYGRYGPASNCDMRCTGDSNEICGGMSANSVYPTGVTASVRPNQQLRATLECPGTITISALPSLSCHILISGWRRNTADPVEVILPQALDTFGNHANGIQVQGRGSELANNWDEPARSWGLFVFACPSQRNTGANCYKNVTSPGLATVPIIVRQGGAQVSLMLTLSANARPGGMTGGGGGGVTTSVTMEASTNRPGDDIKNFEVRDPAMCRQACAADALCEAYTYVKPGLQGKSAHCWLKDNIPAAVRNDCCVSGMKVTEIR